VNNNVYRW